MQIENNRACVEQVMWSLAFPPGKKMVLPHMAACRRCFEKHSKEFKCPVVEPVKGLAAK
jgi:hypothetical protein